MSVVLMVDVRVKPGTERELQRTYAALRERVQQQPGLLSHQLCESVEDPERWLVLSEWESLGASMAWDRSEDHARLLAPMRACFAEASRVAFTGRGGGRA